MQKRITLITLIILLAGVLVLIPGKRPAKLKEMPSDAQKTPVTKTEQPDVPSFNPSTILGLALKGNETVVAGAVDRFYSQMADRIRLATVRVLLYDVGNKSYTLGSEGLGIAVGNDGLILTSCSGVDVAARIAIVTQEGVRANVRFVSMDPASGVAVLQSGLLVNGAATLARQDDLRVGQTLLLVSWDPLLEKTSIEKSLISGMGWAWLPPRLYPVSLLSFQKSSSATLPVAVFTKSGALAGMPGSDWNSEEGSSLKHALVSDQLNWILTEATTHGEIRRGMVGFTVRGNDLLPDDAQSGTKGSVIIASVTPHSAAARAGLKVGELLMKINGVVVQSPEDVFKILGRVLTGTDITLEVMAHTGPVTLQVRVE